MTEFNESTHYYLVTISHNSSQVVIMERPSYTVYLNGSVMLRRIDELADALLPETEVLFPNAKPTFGDLTVKEVDAATSVHLYLGTAALTSEVKATVHFGGVATFDYSTGLLGDLTSAFTFYDNAIFVGDLRLNEYLRLNDLGTFGQSGIIMGTGVGPSPTPTIIFNNVTKEFSFNYPINSAKLKELVVGNGIEFDGDVIINELGPTTPIHLYVGTAAMAVGNESHLHLGQGEVIYSQAMVGTPTTGFAFNDNAVFTNIYGQAIYLNLAGTLDDAIIYMGPISGSIPAFSHNKNTHRFTMNRPLNIDSIYESTADAGVTVDGLLIKDGDIHGTPEAIEFVIHGGGATITTGIAVDIVAKCAMTITGWTLLADQTGSIAVGVWKDSYANFPPTVADLIVTPSITTAAKNQATGLSISIAQGDILRFNVDSVTSIQRLTVALTGVKA